MKSKRIPLGALWGLCVILIYVASFVGIGIYLILGTDYSHFSWKFLLIGGAKALAYFIGGAIVFVPVLLVSLYLIIRDRDLPYTIKRYWPLFILGGFLLFIGVPTFPEGLSADVLAAVISLILETIVFSIKKGKRRGNNGSV